MSTTEMKRVYRMYGWKEVKPKVSTASQREGVLLLKAADAQRILLDVFFTNAVCCCLNKTSCRGEQESGEKVGRGKGVFGREPAPLQLLLCSHIMHQTAMPCDTLVLLHHAVDREGIGKPGRLAVIPRVLQLEHRRHQKQ